MYVYIYIITLHIYIYIQYTYIPYHILDIVCVQLTYFLSNYIIFQVQCVGAIASVTQAVALMECIGSIQFYSWHVMACHGMSWPGWAPYGHHTGHRSNNNADRTTAGALAICLPAASYEAMLPMGPPFKAPDSAVKSSSTSRIHSRVYIILRCQKTCEYPQ